MTSRSRIVMLGAAALSLAAVTSLSGQGRPSISALPVSVLSPPDNPITNDKVALGKLLFWDPILSGNKDVACATCHHPGHAYADGRDLSIGVDGTGLGTGRHPVAGSTMPLVRRNSLTILNAAFNGLVSDGPGDPVSAPMFWDMRAQSLEMQALGPMSSLEEMRGAGYGETEILPEIVSRLQANSTYRKLFANVFGGASPVTTQNLGRAIAAFERRLVTPNSAFDRYMRGDRSAMSAEQVDGMRRFERIGCVNCHNGPMLSDYKMHVLGVADNTKLGESDSSVANTYAFRTPSLRNVALTAPYMHNGTLATLDEVMRFYDDRGFRGGRGRGGQGGPRGAFAIAPTAVQAASPSPPPPPPPLPPQNGRGGGRGRGVPRNPNVRPDQIDPLFRRLGPLGRDRRELTAFLGALTDESFDKSIPKSVPSGLKVGGNIK